MKKLVVLLGLLILSSGFLYANNKEFGVIITDTKENIRLDAASRRRIIKWKIRKDEEEQRQAEIEKQKEESQESQEEYSQDEQENSDNYQSDQENNDQNNNQNINNDNYQNSEDNY